MAQHPLKHASSENEILSILAARLLPRSIRTSVLTGSCLIFTDNSKREVCFDVEWSWNRPIDYVVHSSLALFIICPPIRRTSLSRTEHKCQPLSSPWTMCVSLNWVSRGGTFITHSIVQEQNSKHEAVHDCFISLSGSLYPGSRLWQNQFMTALTGFSVQFLTLAGVPGLSTSFPNSESTI